ncbi:MAG TPA: SPFH domain-containing protein [Anaerolineae bacterium]|jgi:regulator of protease activity HflC (stomatin/prohibitin superfamily)
MMPIIITTVTIVIGLVIATYAYRRARMCVVREDSMAVTVDRDGFFKRLLPTGRHVLYPFERLDFTFETKTHLTMGQGLAIATGDGLLVNINWSGLYALQPDLITENVSQRLRNLPNAQKPIGRNVDILMRKLVGEVTARDLFNPVVRDRLERRLTQLLTDRVRSLGIACNGLNLQAIELPVEVVEALNKAKAIETLDGAIRQLDPTTREVVRGAYQLDEILHWDTYLPTPTRLTMKRLEKTAH